MKTTIRTMGLTALFAGFLALGAQAQPAPMNNHLYDTVEPSAAATSALSPAELSSVDLSGLSEAWWKDLGRAHTRALTADDAGQRALAMRNMIYLSNQYPGQVRFNGAGQALLETYLFAENEGERILAVTAMHAIRADAALRHLAQYVQLERSQRVRKLANKVLVDYFGEKRS